MTVRALDAVVPTVVRSQIVNLSEADNSPLRSLMISLSEGCLLRNLKTQEDKGFFFFFMFLVKFVIYAAPGVDFVCMCRSRISAQG